MIIDKCALVITSCVHVSAPYTFLTDAGERVRQYVESISFFIKETAIRKIIVCDNSDYTYPQSLYDLARSCDKELELLSFRGNVELVKKFGKGYGEGEILEFVLSKSVLIADVEGFIKVTGRLKVTNIDQVLDRSNRWENYFMPISLLRPRFMVPGAARRCVDVRVYYTTRDFFKNVLLTAYKKVRDDETLFLEHAYHDAMKLFAEKVKCFAVAPEIIGMSGSNGWIFTQRTYLKKLLIRVASFLGYIKPIYEP